MIKRLKIQLDELKEIQDKKIVIYGNSTLATQLLDTFNFLNIEVVAFCPDSLASCIKMLRHKKKVLSKKRLQKFAQNQNDVIIQCAFSDAAALCINEKFLKTANINSTLINPYILIESFLFETVLWNFRSLEKFNKQKKSWEKAVEQKTSFKLTLFKTFFKLRKEKTNVILCLPGKTADHTLNHTFDAINNKTLNSFAKKNKYIKAAMLVFTYVFSKKNEVVYYVNVFHRPRYLEDIVARNRNRTIKIITAVREPISQTISTFFESLQWRSTIEDWIFGELENKTPEDQEKAMQELQCLFLDNGENLQLLFNAFVKRYEHVENKPNKKTRVAKTVQQFISEFNQNVLNLYDYPFDQEKGYTIVKKNNIEVFVYQLEKLNDVVPELSEWLGVPFDKLVKANVAEDKWIAESYKQAQKEIKVSQAYFDGCFDESYVKHYYNKANIEEFKARWTPHINDSQF